MNWYNLLIYWMIVCAALMLGCFIRSTFIYWLEGKRLPRELKNVFVAYTLLTLILGSILVGLK